MLKKLNVKEAGHSAENKWTARHPTNVKIALTTLGEQLTIIS